MGERMLIVGNGGREHAIAATIHETSPNTILYVAPGNAGTGQIATNVPIEATNVDGLVNWANEHRPKLAIIGPEAPLEMGLADELNIKGINAFGPSRGASKIESSKVFSKRFMTRHEIPTARFKDFDNLLSAISHVQEVDYPVVIKASGLAAGKGVIVPEIPQEAVKALVRMMHEKEFGDAGDQVVIEERLEGKEVSVLAFTDGHTVRLMPPAKDYKRLKDNDEGPNTGGMGAYAPFEIDNETLEFIRKNVLQKAVDGLAKEGWPFVGVLYAGMILTDDGPKTLEFNCRFGDPETQVILPLMDTPILEVVDATVSGELGKIDIKWKKGSVVSVTLASLGYPKKPATGAVIFGLEEKYDSDIRIFHAGTIRSGDIVLTNAGRVLNLTAYGRSQEEARIKAYGTKINFSGMQFRSDIAMNEAG